MIKAITLLGLSILAGVTGFVSGEQYSYNKYLTLVYVSPCTVDYRVSRNEVHEFEGVCKLENGLLVSSHQSVKG